MTKIIFKNHRLLLLIIILFALFLRVVDLGNTPSGLHADEASFLINSQSILRTGRDEDGRLLPISLNSLIDPKPALYSYLQIPFIIFLGPTVLASRLPSALLGTASLILVYLLLKAFDQKKIGLIMVFLLALSPWHILISRGTQEVITSFFFLLASLNFLLIFLKNYQKKWLIFFGLSAFLAMYMYHSAKVFLTLFVFFWLAYHLFLHKQKINRLILVAGVTFFVFILSIIVQDSGARLQAVGLFHSTAPQARILEQIYGSSELAPSLLLRFVYNKPIAYFQQFITQYLKHFDPIFLFILGGEPKRNLIPFHGLFYLLDLPFLLIGFYFSTQIKRKKLFFFFLFLSILAPVPAALTTQEIPSVIRIFPLILSLTYFVAVGFEKLLSMRKLPQTILLPIIVIVYFWQIFYFGMQYFVQQKVYQPWHRNSPYTEIAQQLRILLPSYSTVRVTNDLRPLYTYFVLEDLITINELQNQPLARNEPEYRIGKFEFNKKSCHFGEVTKDTLVVAEVGCREKQSDKEKFEVVKTIKYPDGVPVYELITLSSSHE